MNKLVGILVFVLIGVGALWSIGKTPVPKVAQPVITEVKNENAPGNAESVSDPVEIRIPKIGVVTTIEYVGMDESGRMGTPSTEEKVAWWKLGPRPGEQGSAVIAGHSDSPQGTPGVFYNLQKLEPGDEIIVTDKENRTYTYLLTRRETYLDAEFPIEPVFADMSGKYLNLITCTGIFDRTDKNYDKRLVVFSELKSTE